MMHHSTTTCISRIVQAAMLGALALALAACGGGDKSGQAASGAPAASVAPPAGKMWSDVVVATPDGGMQMGNPNAPIKLVEYGSLSCPHCAKLAQEGMQTLIDKYVNSGRVSYEFRSYAIHGVIDIPLTVLVRCDSPDAFFPLVEQIYANQDALINRAEAGNDQAKAAANLTGGQRWVALGRAFGLTDFFAARGLPVAKANACLAKGDDAQKVADEAAKWSSAGIDSTPTLVINGSKTDIRTWAELEPALQRAGAR